MSIASMAVSVNRLAVLVAILPFCKMLRFLNQDQAQSRDHDAR